MRAGAAEFLASPFPPSDFQQAVQRIVRRRTAETGTKPARRGRLLAFAPAKGGSGCTTLACGVAAAVKRRTKSNVLLADLDLASGVIGFLLRLKTQYSVIDALRHSSQLDNTLWKSLVLEHNGVDVLAAPERPEQALTEAYPVQQALDFARSLYDYIIVDLDGVTDSVSRVTLAAADRVHLVCCTEMTSLFMMRRTIPLLEDLGRSRDQINVLVNRAGGRPPLSQQDMEKIFRAPVHWTFPEDAAAVARAQREGDTVAEGSDLGKSLKQFVDGLAAEPERESVGGLGALKQLWGKT
jgi:pilus assembly protein CpaE